MVIAPVQVSKGWHLFFFFSFHFLILACLFFSDFSLNNPVGKDAIDLPMEGGDDEGSHENGEWNSSSTSTTIAVCYPLSRRIQPDKLRSSQHSSCSDVSTHSGL